MTESTGSAATDETTTAAVTAEYHIDRTGDIPRLVVTMDFGDITANEGDGWTYDRVISYGEETGTDLTLLFFPQGTDEGWDRVHEVGEW